MNRIKKAIRLVAFISALICLNSAMMRAAEDEGAASASSMTDSGIQRTAFSFPAGATRAPRYAVINLGQTGYPLRLSDSGQVLFGPDGAANIAGYRWQIGKFEALNGAGFAPDDRVRDITNDGTVVGQVTIYPNDNIFHRVTEAAIWQPSVTQHQLLAYNGPDFEPFFDGKDFRSAATVANGVGKIWGGMTISVAGGIAWVDGVSWNSFLDQPARLGDFSVSAGEFGSIASGSRTIPLCANDAGLLAREIQDSDGNFVGCRLGDIETTFYPIDINPAGHSLGWSLFDHSLVWWDGTEDHSVDVGFATPYALDANDNILTRSPEGPVLWQRVVSADPAAPTHHMLPLNRLIPLGYSMDYVNDMNASGAILGSGFNPDTGYGNYLLVPASIALDADRDGQIKLASEDFSDATSSATPFRFWINDDIDRGHTVDGNDFEQDDISPTEAATNSWVEDWKYNTVQSRRDLEDFARIVVSTSGLTDAFRNGDLYLGLKWTDTVGTPSIKLYKQYDATGGTSYLTDDYQASVQLPENAILNQRYPNDDVSSMSAHTVVTPGDLFVLPQGLWIGLTGDTLKRSLLFEGCTAGKGQLKLVIIKRDGSNYTEIGDGPGVWLDLKKIGDMYEHWSVGNGSGVTPDPVAGRVASETGSGSAFSYTTSSLEEQKYILFVHGWNMEKWEKERFAETAYKRLYWQGYKGRFGLFSWPTTTNFGSEMSAILDSTNFDRGEFGGWRSATPLRQLLQSLNSACGGELYVISHSMGGIVMSEALRLQSDANGGQIVKVYVASQAAISAHVYDGTLSDAVGSSNALQWDYNHPQIPNGMPNYGPQTANVYKNWTAFVLHGSAVSSSSVGTLVNFYNENDWALSAPVWQFNQITKPDFADAPNLLWEYYYVGDFTGAPASDGFRKVGKYTNLSGEVILGLGNRTALQDRYEIMSFDSESRVKAFGATPNISQGISGSVNLQTTWPADADNHSAHKWHSGEFRSTIQLERNYWKTLLSTDAFNIPTTTLP
jgi:hypothetical protein